MPNIQSKGILGKLFMGNVIGPWEGIDGYFNAYNNQGPVVPIS